MKPKFTDLHRYPRGYTKSEATDVTRTWAAARKRMEADAEERSLKVEPLRGRASSPSSSRS